MAREPQQEAGEQPTPRQAEGIRQLIMMVKQMQDQMKQQDPERYAQMVQMAQQRKQGR
jgi:hypothetical protein